MISFRPGVGPGVARRTFDLVVVVTALVALAVPMLLVALVIRLESRGPALYRQARIGQGGRIFTIYKFRTMVEGAGGSTLTLPGDSRITRLGRLLRTSCIDELPQLFNVLFGHMTLVGPRPQTPALAQRYPCSLSLIFLHRPGLTGPGVLLLNDDDVLVGEDIDPQAYYLSEVAPARVAVDLDYLQRPTFRRTIGLLFGTAKRLYHRLLSSRPKVAPGTAAMARTIDLSFANERSAPSRRLPAGLQMSSPVKNGQGRDRPN